VRPRQHPHVDERAVDYERDYVPERGQEAGRSEFERRETVGILGIDRPITFVDFNEFHGLDGTAARVARRACSDSASAVMGDADGPDGALPLARLGSRSPRAPGFTLGPTPPEGGLTSPPPSRPRTARFANSRRTTGTSSSPLQKNGFSLYLYDDVRAMVVAFARLAEATTR
jgi:hypothetical protein